MSTRTEKFLQRLRNGEMLLSDGGWNTQLQSLGLQPGQCPEEWNITQPERIRKLAGDFLEAGADMVLTNTFGGTCFRLMRYGLADKVREFNRAGAALCQAAAENCGGFVAASVGPTGEFMEPEGRLKEREMYDAFCDQIAALKAGGADAVCIETMYVLEEALLAIKAAQEVGIFCMAALTFESLPGGFATLNGTTLEAATGALDASSAEVIGTNCGHGIVAMRRLAHRMRLFTKKPLLVRSNAGVPEVKDGKLFYSESPEMMAAKIADLKTAGAAIVGGCCGTTPEHIRHFRKTINALKSA